MRDIHFYVRRVFDRRQGSETSLPAAVKRTACPGPGLWRGFQSCSYGILNDTACPNPLNGGRVYHRERRSATGFDYVLHILQYCSLYMISACCHRTRGTPDIDCGAGYIHNTTGSSCRMELSIQLSFSLLLIMVFGNKWSPDGLAAFLLLYHM